MAPRRSPQQPAPAPVCPYSAPRRALFTPYQSTVQNPNPKNGSSDPQHQALPHGSAPLEAHSRLGHRGTVESCSSREAASPVPAWAPPQQEVMSRDDVSMVHADHAQEEGMECDDEAHALQETDISKAHASLNGHVASSTCDMGMTWQGMIGATGIQFNDAPPQQQSNCASTQQTSDASKLQAVDSKGTQEPPHQPPRRRQRRLTEEGLPTIFEGHMASQPHNSTGFGSGDWSSIPSSLLSRREQGSSRPAHSAFPTSRSEPGSRHVVNQERLSPSQPLAPQVSTSLAALLSVIGGESDVEPRESIPSINSPQQQHSSSISIYRQLELSTSLSALLAILSFESDAELDSPPAAQRAPVQRALKPSKSCIETEVVHSLELSSPIRLQRQGSLDSGLAFYKTKDSPGASPSDSMQSTPMHSPVRTRTSSVQSTPSPILMRRMTGNRNSVVSECWQSGPLRGDKGFNGHSLRSVSDILEEDGTAAFYRGFGADGSPARPQSKRTKVEH